MEISSKLRYICGIYSIMNIKNGKIYVGSSKDIYNRLHEHKHNLKNNKGHNVHLQNSWNKNGEDTFICNVLELCDEEVRFDREQYHIDTLKPKYNFSLNVCGNLGRKITDEQKSKISNTLKEKYKSGEIKPALPKAAMINTFVYNIETFSLEGSFESMRDAFRFIGCKEGTTWRIDRIFDKKYCITKESLGEYINIKNYICENLFMRLKNKSKEINYMISEDESGNKVYHKSAASCQLLTGISRSTIMNNRSATIENPYENYGFKVYFSNIYIPHEY